MVFEMSIRECRERIAAGVKEPKIEPQPSKPTEEPATAKPAVTGGKPAAVKPTITEKPAAVQSTSMGGPVTAEPTVTGDPTVKPASVKSRKRQTFPPIPTTNLENPWGTSLSDFISGHQARTTTSLSKDLYNSMITEATATAKPTVTGEKSATAKFTIAEKPTTTKPTPVDPRQWRAPPPHPEPTKAEYTGSLFFRLIESDPQNATSRTNHGFPQNG